MIPLAERPITVAITNRIKGVRSQIFLQTNVIAFTESQKFEQRVVAFDVDNYAAIINENLIECLFTTSGKENNVKKILAIK